MRLFYVQLETPDKTYAFEVATNDFDADQQAREALATLIGQDASLKAHLGGYVEMGVARNPGVQFASPHFGGWAKHTSQHTAEAGNMLLVCAGSKDGDGILDVIEVAGDTLLSEIYKRRLAPDEYLVTKGPIMRPLLADRRKCGCPEQFHGRYCPACHGTGYIPPLPHEPLSLCPRECR